ncbi:uncharacterized protein LOC123527906 isoform X2 [Mercenaria mercenaria]|uniref:uncharacterized protein LOC123527906 isoform X2 n=1 Tax=Mercenaria mercenaria TaxID=6596 RepID=UPI00234E90D3|nr:uncharacterized protein LOC123527906 isoform X2 [Mercenaria mercenaria]
MDKPVMPATERRNDENSFNVHYMQMQRDSMESVCSVYSFSSGSLPSHFRSLSPKPDVRVTIETDDYKPPSRFSTRTVYIILAAIFIVSSSIAVTVAVHEIQRVIQEESAAILTNYKYLNGTEVDVTTAADVGTIDKATKTTNTPLPSPQFVDPRTHCLKRCTVYGKPKFESKCESGVCMCKGKDFQQNTCLPSLNGCVITKEIHSRYTSIWNSPTTAFHCSNHTGNTEHDVYVIGIYGNHFSESTVVDVESTGVTKALTIVLGSHYPVRWKVKHTNAPITEIVMISDSKLSMSELEVFNEEDVSSAKSPTIRTEFLPVGYGDDRYHSNTAEMLRTISQVVGPIKSFLGANFADRIVLNVAS